jgi:ribose transport system substrate-binding protein
VKTSPPAHPRQVMSLAISVLAIASSCAPATTPRSPPPIPAAIASSVTPTLPANPAEMVATRPWRIAFIPKFKLYGETGTLSSYWQPAWEGARKAGSDFGVDVRLVTSDVLGLSDAAYVEPQIRLVADLIARGKLDGLVIAPFDSGRLAPVVDKAVAAGIPTVAMDTPIDSDRVLTFVAFDNSAGGRVTGEWVVQQLGGKGKALILDGPQDQQNAVDRRNGFLVGLQTGSIDILDTKTADWEIEPARQATAAWLREFPEVDAILAANDNMAIGAAQAVAAAGRPRILITGFDATDAALIAIEAGQISATIDQAPAEQARLAIQLLVRHLETGESPPGIVLLSRILMVTKANAGTYLSQRGLAQPRSPQ